MVFSLSSKKKKNKTPKRNSKVKVQTNSQRNVTVTNNLILSAEQSLNPHSIADPSVYNNVTSSRAIFESRKLESACNFLKCLKQKLEKDIKEPTKILESSTTSGTITDMLETLIDVSNNITPMVSDVSTKWINHNSSSGSSTISEQHFNKTMVATNKLLQMTAKPKATDGSYYFTHKIIANNAEELTIFQDSIHNVDDKIYVDKRLLCQLIELHGLLKDTIQRLRSQEDLLKTEMDQQPTVYQKSLPIAEATRLSDQESFISPARHSGSKIVYRETSSGQLYKTASSFPTQNQQINGQGKSVSNMLIAPSDCKIEETIVTIPRGSAMSPQLSIISGVSNTLRASKIKKKELKHSKVTMKNATTLVVGPPSLITSHPASVLEPEIESPIQVEEMFSTNESTSTTELEGTLQYCDPVPETTLDTQMPKALEVKIEKSTETAKLLASSPSQCCHCNTASQSEAAPSLKKDISVRDPNETGIRRLCPRKNCSSQTDGKPHSSTRSFIDRFMCKECILRRKTAPSPDKPKHEKCTTFETGALNGRGYRRSSGVSKRSATSAGYVDSAAIEQSTKYERRPSMLSGSKLFEQEGIPDRTIRQSSKSLDRTATIERSKESQRSKAKSRNKVIEKSSLGLVDDISTGINTSSALARTSMGKKSGAYEAFPASKSGISGYPKSSIISTSGPKSKSGIVSHSGITTSASAAIKSGSTSPPVVKLENVTPQYIDGLDKCLAELECMRNCLKDACVNKKGEGINECITIFPEGEEDYLKSNYPHFHTFIDGVPVVLQMSKNPETKSGKCCKYHCSAPATDQGNMCCMEKDSELKPPFATRVLGTLSKSGCGGWGSKKRRNSILKAAKSSDKDDYSVCKKIKLIKNKFHTFKRPSKQNEDVEEVESSESIPYLTGQSSLPKLHDPDKICSSLEFDVKTISVTFNDLVPRHPQESIDSVLKQIAVEELLDSFRPAKCCRKTVLNEKAHSKMPYPASLQSLPLLKGDVDSILRIIQSNGPVLYKTQTLYEQYVNFQKNTISGCNNKDTYTASTTQQEVFQVYFFEIFKRDEDDKPKEQSSSRSSSSNVFNDLRILDFLKRIYTSEPLYEKVSKTRDSPSESSSKHSKVKKEKKTKHRHHEKKEKREKKSTTYPRTHQKYKQTERKSFYSSVESYLTSKSNFVLNSASSQVSSKVTKSRNSSMYSFLLIPKSEINSRSSSNDLSTSYAPSVNSLPFENDLEMTSSTSTPNLSPQSSSDECDEFCLSPGNFARTLEAIYELDVNGNMRAKPIRKEPALTLIQHFPLPPGEIRNHPDQLGNLSTIYEADERSGPRDSDVNMYRKAISDQRPRSKNVTPTTSLAARKYIEPSRIPVSINSFSKSNVIKEKTSGSSNKRTKSNNESLRIPKNSEPRTLTDISRLCLPSDLSTAAFLFNTQEKNTPLANTSAFTDGGVPKELIAKVHPKMSGIKSSQIRSEPITNKTCISAGARQHINEAKEFLELPVTFEIVKPTQRKAGSNITLESKVMAYDIKPDRGISNLEGNEIKCYRSENMCIWPQLQKKYEITNRAFYVSVHGGQFNLSGKNKLGNFTSQVQVLQQYPPPIQSKSQNNKEKPKTLNSENFVLGYIGNGVDSNTSNTKSALKKSSVFHKSSLKQKRKTKHICPEVIDIKVSKNIKSTKVKHKIFRGADRPGYVAVLSTPCNCPDVTIFLPCCCGEPENCSTSLVREAQQYAMVPMEKNKKHK